MRAWLALVVALVWAPRALGQSAPASAEDPESRDAQREATSGSPGPPVAVESGLGRREVLPRERLPDAMSATHELALVVSGGVSLGAYEAGYLHLLREAAKRSDGALRIPVLTGASAGSANALLGAIESCREPTTDPRRDLGYRTWVPLGLDQLFDPARAGPDHVLHRGALESAIGLVREVYLDGLIEGCEVTVGMTVTRLHATSRTLRGGVSTLRMAERFALRIRGRGRGRPPHVENVGLPTSQRLPLEADGEREAAARNFDRVASAVLASSAFPGAFAPVDVEVCRDASCARTERVAFVDGGVFENNPLDLAREIARADVQSARARGAEISRPLYVYVDPDTTAYPAMREIPDPAGDLLELVAGLLGDFVATARSDGLRRLHDAAPHLADRLFPSYRYFPDASGLLGAFFGFFERALRRFDFYLGMYDAYAALGHFLARLGDESATNALLGALAADLRQDAEGIEPLLCLMGAFDPSSSHLRTHCETDSQLRALAQLSLDRLALHCRGLPRAPSRAHHPRCHDAAHGRPMPRLVDVPPVPRGDDEDELGWVLRSLAAYGFAFEDLGLDAGDADDAPLAIRRRIEPLIDAASSHGGLATRLLLRSGGRAGASAIAYDPPRHVAHVAFGTQVEIGGAFRLGAGRWVRLASALRIEGLRSLVEPRTDVAFTPSLGLELMIPKVSGFVLAPTIGARFGRRLASADRLGARRCDVTVGDHRRCSQWVVESYAAVALVERVRVQLGASLFPVGSGVERRAVQLDFLVGLQLF